MSQLPTLSTDAEYRAMLHAAIREMMRDLSIGDVDRARSIGEMAHLLNTEGAQSESAALHQAQWEAECGEGGVVQ